MRASIEPLETRTMLSESATAQLSLTSTTGSGNNAVYHYSVTVNDTGTTNVGTFWFGWVPGEDFLPSAPSAIGDPSGWSHTITGSNNSADGSAIEWVATSNAITPGHSLTGFTFSSADSPTVLAANSPSHPASPTTTAFVYSGAAFSDAGFQLLVTPPATTAASTTTLTASNPTNFIGDALVLTATVVPTSGSGSDPTGTVTFTDRGNTIGTAPVGSGGVAILTTSALPIGGHQITASYGGDSNYSSSASAALTHFVTPPANATATTTALTASALSAAAGQTLTFTATVGPVGLSPAPTGSVSFLVDATIAQSVSLASNGTATFTTSTLAAGSHVISAVYTGDASYQASNGSPTDITITTPVPIVTTLVKSTLPAALVAGASAHGSAMVTITNRSASTIGGKVTIAIGARASDGSLVILGKLVRSVNLKPGQKLPPVSVPLSIKGNSLPAGTYTLFANSLDPANNLSTSPAGQSLTVAAGFIALSETAGKSTLPATTIASGKSHAAVTITIANGGNIVTPGKTTVALFATAAGVVDSTAVQIASLTQALKIKPGKPVKVTVHVKQIPALAVGTYTVVALVTDPNQQLTSVTIGSLTITG